MVSYVSCTVISFHLFEDMDTDLVRVHGRCKCNFYLFQKQKKKPKKTTNKQTEDMVMQVGGALNYQLVAVSFIFPAGFSVQI